MNKALLGCVVGTVLTASAISSAALAQERLFDEVRIGVSGSIHDKKTFEPGLFPSATVFFDPFDQRHAESFLDHMLRPRVHVGAIVSTSGGANQVFAGFTWTANVTDKLFIDLGFGGSLTDASLDNPNDRPNVGCRAQFHESAAVGYNITENWRVLATIEHSSNADICDQNDGLSYAGIAVGYKF
ncbi:acyloxyacyl hydrolase [Azospirillum sp.]|uniref:acyloxyacyl hydrolase n=1 Tax=Azospirillum sp. TaxID=34012 RepID=UPI002D4DCEF7|nr:acyloxyacyl hydrolase [Azospirillum sp.]HYF86144.1 acyloxyacyl hydrolase [Azospirillum sp.]